MRLYAGALTGEIPQMPRVDNALRVENVVIVDRRYNCPQTAHSFWSVHCWVNLPMVLGEIRRVD